MISGPGVVGSRQSSGHERATSLSPAVALGALVRDAAGSNLSADLHTPLRSIANGSFASLLFVFATYALIIIALGASVDRDTLKSQARPKRLASCEAPSRLLTAHGIGGGWIHMISTTLRTRTRCALSRCARLVTPSQHTGRGFRCVGAHAWHRHTRDARCVHPCARSCLS